MTEKTDSGTRVLAPARSGPISLTDTRISAICERGGGRKATPEEFEKFCREYGPFLPPDGAILDAVQGG